MFKLFQNLRPGRSKQQSDSQTIKPDSDSIIVWQAQVARADALWSQGKLDEALGLYGSAIEQNPSILEIQHRLAQKLKQQGDLATAYEKLAIGLKNKGKVEQAANYYRQAIQIKAITENAKDWRLRSDSSSENRPPIPMASLKEAAFSFQPLAQEVAIVTTSPRYFSKVEIESDNVSPRFHQRLKSINPQQARDIDWETAQVYLQKALEHVEKQEWQQAALSCKQASQIVPDMAKAYKIWGNALQRMGKTSEAMSCYAKAVEIQPNLAEVYAGIADIYFQQQKWHQAIKHYQKAIIIKPSAKIYRSLADVWRQLGETEKAELILAQAKELEKASSLLENDIKSVDVDVEVIETPKIEIESVEAYCHIAQQLERQNKWQQAAKYYRLALDLSMSQARTILPSSQSTQGKPAKAQISQGQLKQADEVELSTHQEAHFDVDNTVLKSKSPESQLDKAIRRYHKQSKLQPYSAKIHTDLGNLYARKGKWQYAIACYCKAIKLNHQYAKAHLNLGRILFKMGKHTEFVERMQLALTLQPKIGTALDRFCLGNALVARGQTQRAIDFYHQAILLNPRFVQSYYRISEILSQQAKHVEAIKFLEQGIDRNPQDPEFHYLLGQQWEALENWDKAVKTYSQVLRLEPQFPEALRKLNYALARKLKLNHEAKTKSFS